MSINKKTIESFVARNGFIFKGHKDAIEELIEFDSKPTIDALIYQSKKITKELTEAGRYEKSDDILIESLVMCVEVQQMAFWDIKANGVMIYVDKDNKVKQKNHSVSTLDQMTRSILNISAKLGLSALDRHNLKIEAKKADELDD